LCNCGKDPHLDRVYSPPPQLVLAGWTLFKKKENPTHFIDIKTVITKENSCYYSPQIPTLPNKHSIQNGFFSKNDSHFWCPESPEILVWFVQLISWR
jgi:hypothetical protein